MAGAILSDTVLFKSPTCTKRDIAMAERLAKKINIWSVDYKQFHISGQNIAVGQITCGSAELLQPRKEEFLSVMRKEKESEGYDMVLLMITDVLLEGTHLLYVGSDDVIQQAFSAVPSNNHLFLPGVMSRKKQIIPMLTALWG